MTIADDEGPDAPIPHRQTTDGVMTATATRRSASARSLDGRAGSSSDRTSSSTSREVSFSKTLSSADAFADVNPEGTYELELRSESVCCLPLCISSEFGYWIVVPALSFEQLEEAVALMETANLVLRLRTKPSRKSCRERIPTC